MERVKPTETPKKHIYKKVRPYLLGVASLFDFTGILARGQNPYEDVSGEVADRNAIKSDWEVVGRDIQTAINHANRNVNLHNKGQQIPKDN